MAGVQHDPLSDIQAIRRLLDVYQPGFAFLKELIQNADDAGASHLRMIWHPGLHRATHPLLRGPALVALNNGLFTSQDKEALMRMGLGNKGGDSGKIGKFGLGTKSIFHVAEAFFFFTSNGDPELRDILNPWSPRHHKNWDTVEDTDWNLLLEASREYGHNLSSRFTLWIPLRSKEQLGGLSPIQGGERAFPGESTSCPAELLSPFTSIEPQLGLVLPLLGNLKSVEFESADSRKHVIRLLPKKSTIEQDGLTTRFDIKEEVLQGRAEEWQAKFAWPKVSRLEEDASESEKPDKAKWSHSIVLATTPTDEKKSFLRVYWSVFLPVGNGPFLKLKLPEGVQDISLFLHGYFFLNDSRTEILGLEENFREGDEKDTNGIRLAWNRSLACDEGGLIPSLLPAIGNWLEQRTLTQNEARICARALRNSPLFNIDGSPLTRKGSLLYSLTGGTWGWHFIPRNTRCTLIRSVQDVRSLDALKTLTENAREEPKIIFAVDFPPDCGLVGDVAELSEDSLTHIRHLVREDTLNDAQAELLESLIKEALKPRTLPEEWTDVPLYRIDVPGNKSGERVSANEVHRLMNKGDLFRHDPNGLSLDLSEAADNQEMPYLATKSLPPDCEPNSLSPERAAKWLCNLPQLSQSVDKRLPLFKKFSNREQLGPVELNALRYLAHGDEQNRDNNESNLYFRSNEGPGYWGEAFECVLACAGRSWSLVDSRFGNALSDTHKKRLRIKPCKREFWNELILSLGESTDQIDFSKQSAEMIEWILRETPRDQLSCLCNLKLFLINEAEMVSASDESIWLDGGLSIPTHLDKEWKTLRESARILKASSTPQIAEVEQELFKERVLDVSGALQRAATATNPEKLAPLILFLLGKGTPSGKAISALQDACWLRMKDNTHVTPNQILYLEELEEEITSLLHHLPSGKQKSSLDLGQEIRESKAWGTLSTQILAKSPKVFERLAALVDEVPSSLRLGFCPANETELEEWLFIAKNSTTPNLYPARTLLSGLFSHYREHSFNLAKKLGRYFEGKEAESLYLGRLLDLKEIHENGDSSCREKVISVFSLYLKALRESGLWTKLKESQSLLLLNGNEEWQMPKKLVAPLPGIEKKAQIHPDFSDALSLALESKERGEDPESEVSLEKKQHIPPEESAEALRALLQPFRDRLQEKAVGILPAMLGNTQPMRELAQELLGGIDPTIVRDELIDSKLTAPDQQGGSLRERVAQQTYGIHMVKGESVNLESIAGPPFEAPLASTFETVFLPNPNGHMLRWAGGNHQILCIAEQARFESLSDRALRDVLFQSIREFICWAYDHRPAHFERVFEKYEGLGQLSIGIARQEILRAADTQLQLLGVSPQGLEDARHLAQEARSRLAEADSGIGNENNLRARGDEADKKSRALFSEKFDSDADVQNELLAGVRTRISRQQYEIDSIPFEILQNADDAVNELIQAQGIVPEKAPLVSTFEVTEEAQRLTFFYGGRPINNACGLTNKTGSNYKRDLVKMLLLNGSDKNIFNESGASATGKFGLGFKSVFLLTDRPHVVSDQLSFEILGGIWPKEIPADNSARELSSFANYPESTSISLPSLPEKIAECLSRFTIIAPWIPVFTKHLRTIRISTEGESKTHRWSSNALGENARLRHGPISTPEGERLHLEMTNDSIQWLFQIANGHVTSLPKEIPWLWVTTPTREKALGFVLNGPFSLDPGRTRLSAEHHDVEGVNSPLFRQAAELLRECLSELADSPKCFEDLRVKDRYLFWESLWQIFTSLPDVSEVPSGADFLSIALWPREPHAGFSRLLRDCCTLPNGLHGPMKVLTSTKKLKFEIQGWLGKDQGRDLLAIALEKKILPFAETSACCSQSIAKKLRSRIDIQLSSFGLFELLTEENNGSFRIPPIRARLAGSNLWPEESRHQEFQFSETLDPSESAKILAQKETIRFLSENETWETPHELLLSSHHTSGDDEALRSRFAPSTRILSREYGASGARIFRCIRERKKASSEEMAQWVRHWKPRETPKSVFEYLAKGQMRDELATQLGVSWYSAASQSPTFQELNKQTSEAVESSFRIAEIRTARNNSQGLEIPDEEECDFTPASDNHDRLTADKLQENWDPDEALKLFTLDGRLGELVAAKPYDKETFIAELSAPESLTGKATWYRFLCLGSTLGIPLGKSPLEMATKLWEEELTADFWDKTIPKDWKENKESPFESSALDNYFEERIQEMFQDGNASGENASFRRRVFYDFRKMHHLVFKNHLPETIWDLINEDDINGYGLTQFLRSGRIPSSLKTPGMSRFQGVLGQSMTAPLFFMMRELRRLEILDERFDSCSFYLNSPARRVASQLGWIDHQDSGRLNFMQLTELSETVHSRMKEDLPVLASFYDLPLQLYAAKTQ